MKRILAVILAIVMSFSVVSVGVQAMEIGITDWRWGQMFLSNDKFTSFQGTTTLYGDYDYLNFDIRSDYDSVYFYFMIFSDKECTNLLYSDFTECDRGQSRYSPCIKLKGIFKTGTYYLVTCSAKETSSDTIEISTTMIDYEIKVDRTTDFSKQVVILNSVENTIDGPLVTWQKLSSQVKQYTIYRRYLTGTSWTKVGVVDGTALSFVDESVKDINGKYVYTVKATDKNDKNTRYIFNGVATLYCKAPTISSVTAIANNRIRVEWDSVANGSVSYYVYRSTNGGERKLLTQYCSSPKYEDYNVESGNKYEYTIEAKLHTTDGTASSGCRAGKSINYVGIPSITNISAQDNAIRIYWNAAAGATAYTIYRRPYDLSEGWVYLGQVSAEERSFLDETADVSQSYRYTIRSESGDVRGSYSSNGTPYIVFAKQQIEISQNSDRNEMVISWTQDSQAKGYELYSRVIGGEWELVTTTEDTSYKSYPSKIITKEYRVRAFWKENDSSKEALYGEFSDTVSVTNIPGVSISYEAYTDGIELYWGERGAESYNVYRKLASDEADKYNLVASTKDSGYRDTSIERGVKYSYQIRLVYNGEEQLVRLFDNYAGVSADETLERTPEIRTCKGILYFDVDETEDDLTIYGYNYKNSCWEKIKYKDYLGCKPEEHVNYKQDNKHRYAFSVEKDGMKTPIDENIVDYEWFMVTIDYTVEQRADHIIYNLKNIPSNVTKLELWRYGTYDIDMDGSEPYTIKLYNDDSTAIEEDFCIYAYTDNGDIAVTTGYYVRVSIPKMQEAEKLSNGGNKLTISYYNVEPDEKLDGYYIYRRVLGEKKWVKIDTIAASNSNKKQSTTYIDNNVDAGVTYQYTARGYNNYKDQVFVSYFDTKGITVGNLGTPKLKSIKDTSNGFQISWQSVSGAGGYYLYRKTEDSEWSLITKQTGTSYVDKSVKAGTRYYYTVKAYSGSVKSAHNETGISLIRLSTPALQSVVNATGGVTVKWGKVSGAKGYYVYRKTANSGWSVVGTIKNGSTVSFTDKTAKNGSSYSYTVKAFEGKTTSGYNKTGLAIKRLSTPSIASVTCLTNGVSVKWSKVTGASGYYVYRKIAESGWTKVGTIKKGSTVSFTDKTAKNGTTYTYTVRAFSGKDTSSYDKTGVSIKFLATPTLKTATRSSTGVTVKWNKVTGADGYYVYRKTASSGWSRVGTIKNGSTVAFADKTAKKGTTYYYTVKAYSGSNTSAYNTTGIKCK